MSTKCQPRCRQQPSEERGIVERLSRDLFEAMEVDAQTLLERFVALRSVAGDPSREVFLRFT
jgi:hypothetical protein